MITYRKMTPDDVEAVHAIEFATFPTPWTLDSFYYEMRENQYAHYLVAEDETEHYWLLWDVACH